MRKIILPVLLLFALQLSSPPAGAVPLWSVQAPDGKSTVLVLGSVHLLRPADQPLPPAVHDAYRRAGRIMVELDPAELEPAATQAALERIGIATPGRSVAESLQPAEWRRAEALASAAGLDLQAVSMMEPWFASIVLYTDALGASGYEAELGVDQQVTTWAQRDGKPVIGLETLEEQLLLFKTLGEERQREILLKTLEDAAALETDTDALVADWRAGDAAALAARLATDFEGYEDLRDSIVIRRNQAWLSRVEGLLALPGTSLVVVGALHVVGPDGLPQLLEARGYRVQKLEDR
ncbi:TraB/GumN family protein [Wenzhouxiangella sp. XN24]|uniref:TraB/GumN family protein n=1 Tax=Wenzhouxiangella sp. XN24 TaxID=2713569 RepID=UPI0013EA8B43|nr:TraB/GumN family protein [Wenzhouxiangella sp. XN24]NGX15177.1 TraB/GumN family protein [Wenzhouxiangella sp. XN24]